MTEELAGLGDRFRTLADNIPQLAWMVDASGKIHWYNQDMESLRPVDRGDER